MTYLIALAMGTMFSVTVMQLIPEALDLLHAQKYKLQCASVRYLLSWQVDILRESRGGGVTVYDDCASICSPNVADNEFCTLTVGGPKAYIWVTVTLYCFMIFFYDLQKLLHYVFSNNENTHMAELSDDIIDAK